MVAVVGAADVSYLRLSARILFSQYTTLGILYFVSLSLNFVNCQYPNVKYSPFFQSNANQPMPLNADWLRIGRKCQCLTNPFEMDRIGNFGLEPQKKPIQNQSLIIKPMLRNPAANSLPI